MDILVIGGSGHVSGTLVKKALEQGHSAWTVTRGQKTVDKRVKSIIADRHDTALLKKSIEAIDKKWDMVVDCICYSPADMRQDIELFKDRCGQFVFISTDFVYEPSKRKFPQPEDSEYLNQDCPEKEMSYGLKKRLCELELINGPMKNAAWTILRPCHIYGAPSQLGCLPLHGRDSSLIDKMMAGQSLQLAGGGHFLQQPLFVEDLADTVLSIYGNGNAHRKIFNIAGPDVIESKYYYQVIAGILGVNLLIEEVPVHKILSETPDKAPFMCHRIYSLERLKKAGLKVPSTSIETGLRLHVNALKASYRN